MIDEPPAEEHAGGGLRAGKGSAALIRRSGRHADLCKQAPGISCACTGISRALASANQATKQQKNTFDATNKEVAALAASSHGGQQGAADRSGDALVRKPACSVFVK